MSILEQAESAIVESVSKVVDGISGTQNNEGPSPFMAQGLDFAEPTVIRDMMHHLGVDPVKMDTDTISKMKDIYTMSKSQSLPLDEYLVEKGRRIGGKMSPGFMGKLYVYLKALNREAGLRKELNFAQGERSMYEDN